MVSTWLPTLHFPEEVWRSRVALWHLSRQVKDYAALMKKLKKGLPMIGNSFLIARQPSGECDQFKVPLGDYVCLSRSMTRMPTVTCLRFVSVCTIYVPDELDTTRLRRFTCQNGRRH